MTTATIRARLTSRARARVIVVQQPTKRVSGGNEIPAFDFGPADQFGDVEVLAPNGRDILTPDIFREQLLKKLQGFDSERDYIITTGDYTVLFFVGMIVGQRFGSARILRWVSSAKAYQPLVLNVR